MKELLLDVQVHLDIGYFKLGTSSTMGVWPFLGQGSESCASGGGERGQCSDFAAPWRLPCMGPAVLLQETNGKLCQMKYFQYMQDQTLLHLMT